MTPKEQRVLWIAAAAGVALLVWSRRSAAAAAPVVSPFPVSSGGSFGGGATWGTGGGASTFPGTELADTDTEKKTPSEDKKTPAPAPANTSTVGKGGWGGGLGGSPVQRAPKYDPDRGVIQWTGDEGMTGGNMYDMTTRQLIYPDGSRSEPYSDFMHRKVQEVAGLKEKTIDPVWEKYFRG